MGEYIYRRTSHFSVIELPTGEKVCAVHIRYAYKPYLSWGGDEDNKRFRRSALLAVANADRFLERKGMNPSGFKYAVTEDSTGSIVGGTILRWATNVPKLISDYWEKHVVGNMPEPCQECGGMIRKPIQHPVCLDSYDARMPREQNPPRAAVAQRREDRSRARNGNRPAPALQQATHPRGSCATT